MAESREPQEITTDARFARLLAGFLKASFIYPENNARVIEPCNALLAELSPEPGPVRIGGDHEGLLVQGERIECATPNLTWLRATLDKVLLGGICLRNNLPRDSLVEFSRRLRENFSKSLKGSTFAQLWPKKFAGIDLIEWRFEGAFTGTAGEEKGEEKGEDFFGEGTQGHVMLELLESCSGVRDAIGRIEQALGAERAGGEVRSMRIMQMVVRQMPVETLFDPKRAIETVEQVLASAARRLIDGNSAPTGDESLIRRLVEDVGRKIFGSTFQTSRVHKVVAESGRQSKLRGHSGDDEILEDEQAFLSELENLPPVVESEDLAGIIDSPAEELGMLLHFVTEAKAGMELDRLRPRLQARLAALDEAALSVLRCYIEPSFLKFASAQSKMNASAVADALRACGRADLLISTGVMGLEQIVASFPGTFVIFLDSLSADPRGGTEMLAEACSIIGASRITAAQNLLIGSGLLAPERVATILACHRTEVLPLVQIITAHIEAAGRSALVSYLRALKPEQKEAIPLLVVEPAEELPLVYLDQLVQGMTSGNMPANLAKKAVQVLTSYIRSSEERADLLEHRVAAIKGLSRFGAAAPRDLLQELCVGLFAIRSQPKSIRQAAKEVLAGMGRSA